MNGPHDSPGDSPAPTLLIVFAFTWLLTVKQLSMATWPLLFSGPVIPTLLEYLNDDTWYLLVSTVTPPRFTGRCRETFYNLHIQEPPCAWVFFFFFFFPLHLPPAQKSLWQPGDWSSSQILSWHRLPQALSVYDVPRPPPQEAVSETQLTCREVLLGSPAREGKEYSWGRETLGCSPAPQGRPQQTARRAGCPSPAS